MLLDNPNYREPLPQPDPGERDARVLHAYIDELHAELTEAYLKLAPVPVTEHRNECPINWGPALRPGPCTCGDATSGTAPPRPGPAAARS